MQAGDVLSLIMDLYTTNAGLGKTLSEERAARVKEAEQHRLEVAALKKLLVNFQPELSGDGADIMIDVVKAANSVKAGKGNGKKPAAPLPS